MEIQLPKVKERLKWGNDIFGLIVLDISTQVGDSLQEQREIQFMIHPLKFEITHHFNFCVRFGFSLFQYAIKTEIKYGK